MQRIKEEEREEERRLVQMYTTTQQQLRLINDDIGKGDTKEYLRLMNTVEEYPMKNENDE